MHWNVNDNPTPMPDHQDDPVLLQKFHASETEPLHCFGNSGCKSACKDSSKLEKMTRFAGVLEAWRPVIIKATTATAASPSRHLPDDAATKAI